MRGGGALLEEEEEQGGLEVGRGRTDADGRTAQVPFPRSTTAKNSHGAGFLESRIAHAT